MAHGTHQAIGSATGKEHAKDWGYQLGLSSKNLFRRERHQVSGMTHGDDFVHTGPTERLTEFENKMTWVYPIKAKLISYGSTERIKALNRRLHWTKRGIVYQPKHADVLVKDLGLEHGNSLRAPAVHDAIYDERGPLNQSQSSNYRSPVARCLFLSQNRAAS